MPCSCMSKALHTQARRSSGASRPSSHAAFPQASHLCSMPSPGGRLAGAAPGPRTLATQLGGARAALSLQALR